MSKRKNIVIVVIILLISSLAFQLSYRAKISKENYMFKNQQGEIVERNLNYVWGVVSSARKDLTDNGNPNLNRYLWQFSDFMMLAMPYSINNYTSVLKGDYSELIRLYGNKGSQQEIDEVKNNLKLHLSRLEEALNVIMKESIGTDNMRFYSLNSDGNETMQKALKILTQENGTYGNE